MPSRHIGHSVDGSVPSEGRASTTSSAALVVVKDACVTPSCASTPPVAGDRPATSATLQQCILHSRVNVTYGSGRLSNGVACERRRRGVQFGRNSHTPPPRRRRARLPAGYPSLVTRCTHPRCDSCMHHHRRRSWVAGTARAREGCLPRWLGWTPRPFRRPCPSRSCRPPGTEWSQRWQRRYCRQCCHQRCWLVLAWTGAACHWTRRRGTGSQTWIYLCRQGLGKICSLSVPLLLLFFQGDHLSISAASTRHC